VAPLLERIAADPAWFQSMPPAERKTLDERFWIEGRLRLEPWLGPRVQRPEITLHPGTRLVGCEASADALHATLDDGSELDVDHVLYATGYRVALERLELLARGNLLERIHCRDGFPMLDTSMQTSVPGLFVTSLPATRNFGLFFAFTAAVRASARIVGRAVADAGR
jgi:thioredoxin reductase